MFQINEKIVRRYASDSTFDKGMEEFRENKVTYIDKKVFIDKATQGELIQFYAEVEPLAGLEYEITVEWNTRIGFTKFNCTCNEFHEHHGGSFICSHIVAALLEYNKENNRPDKGSVVVNTESFIEQLKRTMSKPIILRKELYVEFKYELEVIGNRASSIELKVGEDKTYVVRNMRNFLEAVKQKNSTIEFGKGFIFDPKIHGFAAQDQAIIDLLIEIFEVESRSSRMAASLQKYLGTSGGKILVGKKAYLTTTQLKRFFSYMAGRSLEAVISGKSFSGVNIVKEDLPLAFRISTEEDVIKLNLEENMPIPLVEDGEYFFYGNHIYNPSQEQIRLYAPFYNELKNSKEKSMIFSKEDGEKVASYIIPNLKRISQKIEVDKQMEERFYEERLEISFYFDKAGDNINADLFFHYGDLKINAFYDTEDRKDGRVLLRDVDGEMRAEAFLCSFGFFKEKPSFILKEEGRIVQFLNEGIVKLQEIGEVYYSESFKNIKIYSVSNVKSKIRLNESDLLEFHFDLEGVERQELKNIFKALREKRKYFKLKKGGFVSLEEKELGDMLNLFEYLDIKDSDLEKDSILLSKYNALYIDESLKQNNWIRVEKNKAFKELVNNVKDIAEVDFSPPVQLEEIMRKYQKFGFRWLKTLASCGFGGILADEMGLGKTLQAIAFLQSEKESGNKKPALVITPTSLVYNWKDEIEKFAPSLKALVVSGSKTEREELRKSMEENDIIITSYPLIRRDIEEYKDMEFSYCFLDEAQQIKNPVSLNAQSVKEIKAGGYFALTGTPMENSLTELWSIFDFIMPGYLLSQGKFSKKYEIPIVKHKDRIALEELSRHIKPFILRRLKKEVVKELPPKIEHKILIEMTEEQKKLYAAYMVSIKEEIDEEIREKGFNKSKMKILAALTRLRQICCDPSVFIENFEGDSGKMLALDEILEESIGEGHRILLFSQFTSVLKNIVPRLKKNDIEYMYLDGSTKGEERGRIVKEFNEGKGAVFLISLKAGGTGLNLTGADVVIHFDPWWNPAVEDQASDRAHRIGQKKTVEIIKLIARGSIEEKIFALQEKKKEMIQNIMTQEKEEEFLLSQMTEEELKGLFR